MGRAQPELIMVGNYELSLYDLHRAIKHIQATPELVFRYFPESCYRRGARRDRGDEVEHMHQQTCCIAAPDPLETIWINGHELRAQDYRCAIEHIRASPPLAWKYFPETLLRQGSNSTAGTFSGQPQTQDTQRQVLPQRLQKRRGASHQSERRSVAPRHEHRRRSRRHRAWGRSRAFPALKWS